MALGTIRDWAEAIVPLGVLVAAAWAVHSAYVRQFHYERLACLPVPAEDAS